MPDQLVVATIHAVDQRIAIGGVEPDRAVDPQQRVVLPAIDAEGDVVVRTQGVRDRIIGRRQVPDRVLHEAVDPDALDGRHRRTFGIGHEVPREHALMDPALLDGIERRPHIGELCDGARLQDRDEVRVQERRVVAGTHPAVTGQEVGHEDPGTVRERQRQQFVVNRERERRAFRHDPAVGLGRVVRLDIAPRHRVFADQHLAEILVLDARLAESVRPRHQPRGADAVGRDIDGQVPGDGHVRSAERQRTAGDQRQRLGLGIRPVPAAGLQPVHMVVAGRQVTDDQVAGALLDQALGPVQLPRRRDPVGLGVDRDGRHRRRILVPPNTSVSSPSSVCVTTCGAGACHPGTAPQVSV